MVVAIAPWSIVLAPGQAEVIVPQGDLQIKNAALPDELEDDSARTSVKLTYSSLASVDDDDEDEDDEDEEDFKPKGAAVTTVLCSLTPGKIEQSSCEIILEQDMEYILEAVGKNTIHLYGNYIDQVPNDQPPFGSEMDSDEDDAYDLNEVSSDVEIAVDADEAELHEDGDDDAARFEELKEDKEEPPKNLKRHREDPVDVDEHEKLSKSQKKKLAKKLKGADGKAVSAPEPEQKVEENKAEKKERKEKREKKGEKEEKEEGKAEKKGKTDKKEKGDKERVGQRTLEGGLKVWDFKTGSGKTAKKGDKLEIRYIGKLADGRVFDKNTKGKPFIFTLGQGDVIKGWDLGVEGMQVEGERELVIPPALGYGKRKMSDIPPNSTLTFEVKLLAIK